MNFNVAIASVKGSDYRIYFWVAYERRWCNKYNEKFQSLGKKLSDKTTYYQRKKKTILNRAKKYHSGNKERLTEEARDKYRELSEKEKNVKGEYEQRLKEYQRKYCEAKKLK